MNGSACHCGAPIHWAKAPGFDLPIKLDVHESAAGPARYRVVEFGSPWLVEPIDIAARSGYPDHRLSCPAVGAAERQSILSKAPGRGDDVRSVDDGPRAGQPGPARQG